MMRKLLILLAVVSLAMLQLDCATKKSVKKEVDRIDKEMDDLGTSVEEGQTRLKEHDSRLGGHDQQIGQLSKETQEALARAQSAEKLAQGKLLYEVTLSGDDVKFGFDQADLNDSAREVLENLITQLKADNKNVYIEIQGHTDSFGSEAYNEKLGLMRAEAVRRYLSENGIPLHRIATISYGEGRPVTDNRTKAGRAKNRRVVILVLE
jgi:outer membrane protein OmpA-like peptidoglycan-associated protein